MAEQKAKVVKVGRGGPRGPRPKVQNPGKIFMRILRYVMECYRIQVVAVVICIFVSVFANVQGTLFMQTLIDGYILPLLKEQSSDFSGLAHAIARTAGFYGIGIVAAFAQARMMAYVTQGTLKRLRDEMFTHMQTLPIKYFDRNAHGDIMSLYTNDIDTLRQMISQSMPQLLNSAITVVSVLVSMVVLSVPLTVLTLVMVGIMLLVTKYLTTNSSKYFVSQQRDIGAVNGYIEEMMNGMNQAMIDVRGVKQAIWKREMDRRPDIRIKYASKYDESSNYWKNSIGTNKAIQHLKVLEKKRAAEAALREWIQAHPEEREKLIRLFSSLELNYGNRREINRALAYFGEAFINGPELVQLALEILNFDFEAEEKQVVSRMKKLLEKYDNLDTAIDKEVFAAMLKEYQTKVDKKYLPAMYDKIDTLYNGNIQAYVDSLYATSNITSPKGLKRFLERDTTYNLIEDPAVSLSLDLIVKYYEMNQGISEASEQIEQGERLFNDAMRRMYADRNFYPDANSTMRLSFGTVSGYSPFDGVTYGYYTTVKGIFEKVKEHAGDIDFAVQPELLSLLSSRDFGRYANEQGDMNVCFISNNDITGGNSGSAMFNGKGELLGLAFDGNWEAMSSDIVFEPDLQRCIGVDVRYMLFIIEKYGKAGNLIKELKIR